MAGGNVTPQLGPLFAAAGAQYHIPAEVLAGVASVETSLGQDRSTSSAGAQGLMQFMPGTAAQFGNNPATNDRAAVFDAAKLLNQYGYQQNPLRALGAYNGGPGNPQYSYANQVMSEAARLKGQLGPYLGGKSAAATAAPAVAGATATKTKTTTPGGVDWSAAGLSALMRANSQPIRNDGSFKASNPLGDLLSASTSGLYTKPATTSTTTTPGAPAPKLPGAVSGAGSGDVNPLHGWNIGRTDMGVDASARVGMPIRAINDSKVVEILPNWYAGQPLILMQLTAGPNAGKYWYAAEQVSSSLKVGDTVPRGATVATFAPSGTGIEVGWGSPTAGSRTLAGQQGNTGDASHNNAPAGIDFRNRILSLK